MKAVSVILTVAENSRYANQCLQMLQAFLPKGQFEIITVARSQEKEEKGNLSAAWNRVVQQAEGEYLFFLHDDVVLCRRTFSRLYHALQAQAGKGIVFPASNRSHYPDDQVYPDPYEDFQQLLQYAETVEQGFSSGERLLAEDACFFMQRETYQQIGGFDEGFFSGKCVLADYSLRLRDAGMPVTCVAAYIHHEPGGAELDAYGETADYHWFEFKWGLSFWEPHCLWAEAIQKAKWQGCCTIQRVVAEYHQKLPLVSVMIPTYNRPQLFEQTLCSVLRQRYPSLEILICDNSTDERTEMLMEKYVHDPRVHYYRNVQAKTKAENFQPFEYLAHGEYLQWLMDDDILADDKIWQMAAILMTKPQVTLCASRRGVIDETGKELGQLSQELDIRSMYALYDGNAIGHAVLTSGNNFIGEPSSVLFRRRDIAHHYWQAEVAGYAVISDVAMYMELMEKGDCVIFRDVLSWYRRHSGQEGQQIDVLLQSCIEWVRLLQSYYQRKVFVTTKQEYRETLAYWQRNWEKRFTPHLAAASNAMREQYLLLQQEIQAVLKE